MSSPQDNPPPIAPHSAPIIRPWSSLLIRDYRLIFITILCANTANHMRNVASLYQVYHLSGSSVQLGLAGFFQAFPFIIFGLFGGVLADTLNRKKLIVITHSLNVLPGLALGALTLSGDIQVWHINVLNIVASSLQVLGGPSRQAIIPGLVPQSYMLNAVTMATLMMQGTQLTAPVIAGFLIDFFGVQASYFADAALLVPSVISTLLIRASGRPQGKRRQISWRSLIEGFEFLWHTRIILSLFLLDFFAVLFGFFRPILPIFADTIYNVGARGLGMLYAAPAIGALIGSGMVLAAGDIKRKGALSILATLAFALSLGFLGLSQWFWLGLIALGFLGISDAISVAMRRTVVQLLAPDNMRGRATSFLTVFAQTTNATGAVIAGAGAALLGAPNAALVGSVLCTLTIIGTCWAIPQLWHYRSN
ncbi:MAG TPA: MFS transporter [Candidatus Saccharimonadales bacterium]|nr:MFS transporter [Candidatus Saccharimonadales bacterium]